MEYTYDKTPDGISVFFLELDNPALSTTTGVDLFSSSYLTFPYFTVPALDDEAKPDSFPLGSFTHYVKKT